MKQLWKIYLTQFRLFTRDVPTVIVTFVLPIVLGLFFSLIFSSNQQGSNISLTLVDHDGQREVRYMIEELIKNAGKNGINISKANETEALKLLRGEKTDAVIIFPESTSEAMTGYNKIEIPVYYNSDQMLSGIARLIIQNILAEINLSLNQADKILVAQEIPVIPRENKSQESTVGLGQFYLPNFLAISFLWFSLFATALPLVKEREEKIHLRLGITPLSPALFIIGTILWRLTLGVLNSFLFLLVGVFTIKLSVFQNFPLFIIAIIIGNLTFIALGYMIAAISKKIQQAEVIAQVCNFIMMFLSGVFFTAGMLPDIIEKIAYFIPLTYLGDMFRQIMVGYQGMMPLWVDGVVLMGCGLLFTVITVKNWRWQ